MIIKNHVWLYKTWRGSQYPDSEGMPALLANRDAHFTTFFGDWSLFTIEQVGCTMKPYLFKILVMMGSENKIRTAHHISYQEWASEWAEINVLIWLPTHLWRCRLVCISLCKSIADRRNHHRFRIQSVINAFLLALKNKATSVTMIKRFSTACMSAVVGEFLSGLLQLRCRCAMAR